MLVGLIGCSNQIDAQSVSATLSPTGPAISALPTDPSAVVDSATNTAIDSETVPPGDRATTTAVPTEPATAIASAQPSPVPQSPAPTELALNANDVVLHPVPIIYAGDKVTFQLFPDVPEMLNPGEITASILIDDVEVVRGPLDRRNWNGRAEGVYEWAWDTSGLEGEYRITVIIDPDDLIQAGDEDPTNNTAEITTTVKIVAGKTALMEAAASWQTIETPCCVVHFVSNTAAARDYKELMPLLETAVQQASTRLDEQPSQKLQVYFIDRVVGQGGFAGTDMVVSYVDRRYAGGGLYELLVHEAIHIIDQQFAPRRISFLAEGLAVWGSGGHYKQENLTERTAALLQLGRYIPLSQIINDFYPVQHEIGYLQAAGFVTYLIERNGWTTFKNFYSDAGGEDGATLAEAVDVNLQRHYGTTLSAIEAEWLASLQVRPPRPEVVSDLSTTIQYYDVARQYQAAYDPTAHFLNAWLPHPTLVREMGNPADLNRRPETEMNVTLELLLATADLALREGRYDQANAILNSVDNIIISGNIIDPMATDYLGIVRAAAVFKYELHAITLQGNSAQATATLPPNNRLTNLNMEKRGSNWVILSH